MFRADDDVDVDCIPLWNRSNNETSRKSKENYDFHGLKITRIMRLIINVSPFHSPSTGWGGQH